MWIVCLDASDHLRPTRHVFTRLQNQNIESTENALISPSPTQLWVSVWHIADTDAKSIRQPVSEVPVPEHTTSVKQGAQKETMKYKQHNTAKYKSRIARELNNNAIRHTSSRPYFNVL